VVLIGSNADVIACYEVVRASRDEVARAIGWRTSTARRDERFNPLRDRLRQSRPRAPRDSDASDAP